MKSGAVQHSPPDKSQPEPGPWSPVWPNFLDTSFFWHGFSQCITCEYIVKLEKYRKSFDNRLRLLSNIIQKEKINIDMIWVGNYGSSFRYEKLQMSWLYTVVTMLNWLKYLVCYVAWRQNNELHITHVLMFAWYPMIDNHRTKSVTTGIPYYLWLKLQLLLDLALSVKCMFSKYFSLLKEFSLHFCSILQRKQDV